MYMYICIYVYTYIDICTHPYKYTSMHTCMYICVHTHMYSYMFRERCRCRRKNRLPACRCRDLFRRSFVACYRTLHWRGICTEMHRDLHTCIRYTCIRIRIRISELAQRHAHARTHTQHSRGPKGPHRLGRSPH